MAINLRDVPDAVKAYLDTKVLVTISAFTPASGTAINPNESFTFSISVHNAIPLAGGIALTNVRYRVAVANQTIARIRVPAGGSATDLAGNPVAPNTLIGGFIFKPTGDNFELGAGEIDSLALTGVAGTVSTGGATGVTAFILADIDLNQLFPRDQDSTPASKTLTVVG